MKTYYRKLQKNNNLYVQTDNDTTERYEVFWTDKSLILSPNVTPESKIVRKVCSGMVTLPRIITDRIGISKFVRMDRDDDGTITICPVYNGRCEFCNERHNLLEYDGHKICAECVKKITNSFEV